MVESDITKEAGFTVTAEELQKAQEELLDEQLDGAAGGLFHLCA